MSMNRTIALVHAEEDFMPSLPVTPSAIAGGLVGLGMLLTLLGGVPALIGVTLPLALTIIGLAALTLLIARWHEQGAAWFVLLSLTGVVLLLRLTLAAPGLLVLLVLPALLGVVMLGRTSGIGLALGNSGLALALWRVGAVDPLEGLLAALVIGLTVWLYWVALGAFQEVVRWSWRHYHRAQLALEEVRDGRVQLHQTLTDLAHANRQLELLNKHLAAAKTVAEDARKAKAAFVANVSHEFRTPLNMIIGLADLLVETPHLYGAQLSPLLLEDLEIVQRNAQHLLSMINDVLDLSQVEADQLALHRDWVDLADVVEKAAAVVQPLLVKKETALQVITSPQLPLIYCDKTRIRQVIVNLLSNAARHTEAGQVTVEVQHSERWVTVGVRDTGPGIPAEEAAHIFEPFYRGAFGARRNEIGSGLGLSISRQFIELHDGKIWLESTVGMGSAFSFRLPLQSAPAVANGPQRWLSEAWSWYERTRPTQLPDQPAQARGLICDATGDLQAALTRFNDQMSYERVASLAEAATTLAHFPAEFLLINAPMPRLLVEQMSQAQQLWRDLPVIGCCLPPRLSNVLAAGALGQLLKPVTRTDLAAMLAQCEPLPQTTLLVDDDADGRRLFRRMLIACHPQMRVVTAANGAEALAKMASEAPDLVLLDIILPDMDGWEVLSIKAQRADLRAIPVVLLSAQDPNQEPLATHLLTVALGEPIPFAKLLRFTQLMPRLLRAADG